MTTVRVIFFEVSKNKLYWSFASNGSIVDICMDLSIF